VSRRSTRPTSRIWLIYKAAYPLGGGLTSPRTVAGNVRLYFDWVAAVSNDRSAHIDFPVRSPPNVGLVTLLPGALARGYAAYFAVYSLLVLLSTGAPFALSVSFARARPGAAGVVAAVGALIKLVPALILALPLLRFRREPHAALRSLASFSITLAVGSFKTQSNRGIEFGSLGAGLLRLLGQFVLYFTRVDSSGACLCIEVRHTGAPAIAAAALPIQTLARRRQRDEAGNATLLLLAYVLAGKVLSPRYLLRLAPFVVFRPHHRRLFLAACLLTIAVYPFGLDSIIKKAAWPIVAL